MITYYPIQVPSRLMNTNIIGEFWVLFFSSIKADIHSPEVTLKFENPPLTNIKQEHGFRNARIPQRKGT